jgi:aldehyde dehydrogenase (NAD+)
VADAQTCRVAEYESAGNLKRVWTSNGSGIDWMAPSAGTEAFLGRAVEIKNVWVPYGD